MKAQFEAMGLAMIVILIALGMLLLIIFGGGEKGDSPARYETRQLAQNTVNAMLRTSVPDCGKLNYEDLVEDIIIYKRNPCIPPGETEATKPDLTSEAIVEKMSTEILNKTLDARQIRYKYVIRDTPPLTQQYTTPLGSCNQEVENVEPGTRIIRLAPTTKTAEARLWIC